MTDDLRGKIAKIIKTCCEGRAEYLGYNKGYGVKLEPCVDQILALIKEAGYVQLDEDQELPDVEDFCQGIQESSCYEDEMTAYREAQQDMLKQGWRKVKELEK